ncbi:MAG: hypothetical protein ACTHKC_09190, partial [Candidatus Nitrosocosmicus sp.]
KPSIKKTYTLEEIRDPSNVDYWVNQIASDMYQAIIGVMRNSVREDHPIDTYILAQMFSVITLATVNQVIPILCSQINDEKQRNQVIKSEKIKCITQIYETIRYCIDPNSYKEGVISQQDYFKYLKMMEQKNKDLI